MENYTGEWSDLDRKLLEFIASRPMGIWFNRLVEEFSELSRVTIMRKLRNLVQAGLVNVERDPNHSQRKIFKVKEEIVRAIESIKDIVEESSSKIVGISRESQAMDPCHVAMEVFKIVESEFKSIGRVILSISPIGVPAASFMSRYAFKVASQTFGLIRRVFSGRPEVLDEFQRLSPM